MKLMIASDLHGSAFYCRQLLAAMEREQPDKLLLLGDILYHGPRNDLPEGYAPKEVIPRRGGPPPACPRRSQTAGHGPRIRPARRSGHGPAGAWWPPCPAV